MSSNPFSVGVDDSYNPFQAGGGYTEAPAARAQPSSTDYDTTTPLISNQAPSNSYKDTTTGLNISEEELARKEEALRQREEKIAAREREIEIAKQNGTYDALNTHKRNFPIILKLYRYYPDDDLPADSIKMVQLLKVSLYIAFFVWALNFIVCCCEFAPGIAKIVESIATHIIFAGLFVCFGPLIFTEICMMLLYDALKNKKGVRYFFSIVTTILYIAFAAYMSVFKGWGSNGFMMSIDLFKSEQNKWVAIIAIIYSVIASLHTAFVCYIFVIMIHFFRTHKISELAAREAAGYAANYAVDHKTELIQAAKDNPDVAINVAQTAATYT